MPSDLPSRCPLRRKFWCRPWAYRARPPPPPGIRHCLPLKFTQVAFSVEATHIIPPVIIVNADQYASFYGRLERIVWLSVEPVEVADHLLTSSTAGRCHLPDKWRRGIGWILELTGRPETQIVTVTTRHLCTCRRMQHARLL